MDKCYNGSTGIRPLSRLALLHGGGVLFSLFFSVRLHSSSDSRPFCAFPSSVVQTLSTSGSGGLRLVMQSVGGGGIVGWVRSLVGLAAAAFHVWLPLLVKCLLVGESLTLWATQCTWTGTPPGRHTTSGSLKVLWHRWQPFLSDTRMGFFLSFS